MFAAFVSLMLVGPLPEPNCQRFCLGECHFDWKHHRCADTRVEYIGTTEGIIPQGYKPADISDFKAYYLPDPKDYGSYDTEKDSNGNRNGVYVPVAPPPTPPPFVDVSF